MAGVPALTLPEELLILCANTRTGVVECPEHLTRALAGAALAELHLRGGIVIEGDLITEVRPMTVGEPVLDEVHAALVLDVRLGRPGARQTRLVGASTAHDSVPGGMPAGGWARRVAVARAAVRAAVASTAAPSTLEHWMQDPCFLHLDKRYLQSLEERGVLTADRRRVLGVLPRTVRSTAPHRVRQTLARLEREIRPCAYAATGAPPSPRSVHLACFAHAAGISGRLFAAEDRRTVLPYIARLAGSHPLARISAELIRVDSIP